MRSWIAAVCLAAFLPACARPPAQSPVVLSDPPPGAAQRQAQSARAAADALADASVAAAPVAPVPSVAHTADVPVPPSPATGTQAAQAAQAAPSRPLYYTRAITPEDLAGRTLRELALMRNYPFARAGNPFRRPWLAAYFAGQSWYHPGSSLVRPADLAPMDRQNADAVGAFDVGQDRAALVRLRDQLVQRDAAGAAWEGDNVEAMLVGSRLGERVTLTQAAAAVDPQTTPLDDPDRLDTLLAVTQLRQLSPRDLRIVRNMIGARRGRTFRAASLDEYFSNMAWYHPDPSYNDARLTRIDRQNIRLIQSVEAELGGPMTEARIREEDSLSSGA